MHITIARPPGGWGVQIARTHWRALRTLSGHIKSQILNGLDGLDTLDTTLLRGI